MCTRSAYTRAGAIAIQGSLGEWSMINSKTKAGVASGGIICGKYYL